MRKSLAAVLAPLFVALAAGCAEQPLDPDLKSARGGVPGPPPGAGPPPGTPIPPGAGAPFLSTHAVGAGFGFSCALQSSLAYCWGDNGFGQLGDGTTTDSPNPVAVGGDLRFTALAVGNTHACGIATDGTAWCWGSNADGELGAGLPTGFGEFSSLPVEVSGGHSFVTLAAGLNLTCGITDAGGAYCWGRNESGQLGDGTIANRNVPVAVNTNLAFESISVDFRKSCGLATDGTAYCWGTSTSGDFGNGDPGTTLHPAPVQAAGGLALSSIAAGVFYACGVDPSGTAQCWGNDFSLGKLGRGSLLAGANPSPAPVVGGLTFQSLALDVNNNNSILGHTCGVTTSGEAYCWGDNNNGQLGGPGGETCEFASTSLECSSSPVLVQGGLTFSRIAVGAGAGAGPFGGHTCGLAAGGDVYCWGANGSGQLGDGTLTDSPAPVMVNLP